MRERERETNEREAGLRWLGWSVIVRAPWSANVVDSAGGGGPGVGGLSLPLSYSNWARWPNISFFEMLKSQGCPSLNMRKSFFSPLFERAFTVLLMLVPHYSEN